MSFWRGRELTDTKQALGRDGDHMAHVQIRSAGDIDKAQLTTFVKQAVRLNAEKGNPAKRG